MVVDAPEWGVKPVPPERRILAGKHYFMLWSSLGVGLLVFAAGSLLSAASFYDALLAIIIGSVAGSFLLALAGKIGSDHGVSSIISMRPSFGIRGSYIPALLNLFQLVGWTAFEIMIMSKAAEMLVGAIIPAYVWAAVFGALVAGLGIAGPLKVVRQWLGKFAVWVVYATSVVIIISLLSSPNAINVINSPGSGMSFFSALDIVIAMPVSWLPLVADYNRFARKGRNALIGTLIGFALTNILFYIGGMLIGVYDTVALIAAVQAIFFGLFILVLIVDEADNAFADVYSAAMSTLNIFKNANEKSVIIGLTALSTVLAIVIPLQQYEVFILMIGALFVPLFGVVLADYYLVRGKKYTMQMMYGKIYKYNIGIPAVVSWAAGALLYYLLSPLSPIFLSALPPVGATIPSFALSLAIYLGLTKVLPSIHTANVKQSS